MPSSNAEIHTLAAPYGLHALPVEEAAVFEQHLAACSACQIEVDEIRETAARLGMAESVQSPSHLKTQVMDRIREVRPLPPVATAETPTVGANSRFFRWFPRASVALAAAATLVAVVLGVELRETNQELSQVRAHEAQMGEVLAARDVEIVRADEGDFRGTVIMSRDVDAAMVMVHGMELAPSGRVYQLWFIDESGARSAGLMADTESAGTGTLAASGLGASTALGLTLEPAGGSDQPTADPVMVIELPVADA